MSVFTMTSEPSSSFVSPPCLLKRPLRRPRHSKTHVYASSSLGDDFFLPANQRSDIRRTTNQSSRPTSISTQRARKKGREKINLSVEDKDELIRSEIADENISADDLFGVNSEGLLNGSVIICPENEKSAPDSFPQSFSSLVKNSVKSDTNPSTTTKKSTALNGDETKDEKGTPKVPKSTSDRTSDSLTSFINIGDLVNHERHGIGRFLGLERRRGTDAESTLIIQEYAVIEYRDGDVYVPLSHFECITRLSNVEAKRVDRLDVISNSGSMKGYAVTARNRRSKYLARQRTRDKIRRQLINLHGMYAERTMHIRDPFPINEESEAKFCQLCSFELTKDQHEATNQILSDMSGKDRPMDRLLCGDVGFGKTEVSMRAAFRSVLAGKQVVVMAPTTILSQQHYETFLERFHKFDSSISVACFNRFVPRKVLAENRKLMAENQIKIAIGTHMLLGERMVFPNLGLLIVDEEHRFGVNQKEKLRAKHRNVDTLFLSATPIPRTLHLSLSGLRDASVLRTPPAGRKPVQTRVEKVGSGVVRNAIFKEIERGGQVFFVVPRIEGIEATAEWIEELFEPESVRVLIAHGASTNLEKRIWAFAQRQYDVLLCTTVIENGIDMPSVNTIIIQDASRFGLAQLHQLRGRVGRGDIQAFAWLLYYESASQSLTTHQKLKALEENSQLGAGFAIAQRDMEMRGIGTVLGVEQHGNNAVGAEEYARMLAEELECVRSGKPLPMRLPVTDSVEVLLPIASYIPDEYVQNFDEKMRLYKRLSDCVSHGQVDEIAEEIELTYGQVPPETRKHITLINLKLIAKDLGIQKIWAERQHVVMDWRIEAEALQRLVTFLPDKVSRDRCEHVAAEERVVIRGLGIAGGDIQLAKMYDLLEVFLKASVGFGRENDAQKTLSEALLGLG